MGIPAAPVVTNAFVDLVHTTALGRGMPNLRFTFVPHPVAGRSDEQLRNIILGTEPVAGSWNDKPFLESIFDALTVPLTADEMMTGEIERNIPRYVIGDSEDEVQDFFRDQGWGDFLPVILPTEARVQEMLTGSSHGADPQKVVGSMTANAQYEKWSYTVEKIAVNAVMAGLKPEQFPVALAIGAHQTTSLSSSSSSFAAFGVINGPIRHELGMNSGTGALGPFNHTNMVLGRVWNLISINLGNSGVPGVSFLGSQGSPLTRMTTVFAENEEASPWEPFHVTKGFDAEDSVFSSFSGRTLSHLLDIRPATWEYQLANMFASFTTVGLNATMWVEPQVAKTLHDSYGFENQAMLSEWVQEHVLIPYEVYWDLQTTVNYLYPRYTKGEEPYVSYYNQGPGTMIRKYASPDHINAVVVGGSTNAYFMATDFGYGRSIKIDDWR